MLPSHKDSCSWVPSDFSHPGMLLSESVRESKVRNPLCGAFLEPCSSAMLVLVVARYPAVFFGQQHNREHSHLRDPWVPQVSRTEAAAKECCMVRIGGSCGPVD